MKTNFKSTSVPESTVNPGSLPAPVWYPARQASTFMVEHKKLPKSRMIGKPLLSGATLLVTSKTCTEYCFWFLGPFLCKYTFVQFFSLSILSIFSSRQLRRCFKLLLAYLNSRLQFGSVAVKHNSSITAFAMADGFALEIHAEENILPTMVTVA